MSRSGLFGPTVCRLLSAESGPHSYSSGAHSGGRLEGRGASMSIHMYQRRWSAAPKVQRRDGAVVGQARSAARGPARGAARV